MMVRVRVQSFVVAGLIELAGPISRAAERPAAAVDFNRDIRPILSDTCFICHGPDETRRKAKLRLDLKEGALATLKDGQYVIKPGDPSRSEVYRRITAKSPDDLMPPPDSHLALTPAQIELFRRWIEQGAEWAKHWAFVPPADVRPPRVKDARWPRNAIDHFIAARLEQEGLRPAPEATRERLIRRPIRVL